MTSLDPNLLDLLERYVSDEMTDSERLNFEDRLSKEQEIGDALDFFLQKVLHILLYHCHLDQSTE